MIQIPKRTTLIGIFTLFITLAVLFVPAGGQAQGVESTPSPEVTLLPGPTSMPDTKQIESIPQVQSSLTYGTQTDRGLDPETLTAIYYDSYPYFPIRTEPWKQPIDFFLSCYEESYPFIGCKIISDLDNGREWSIRWEGTLIVPVSGEYTFSLPEHDDGAQVSIDNELVIDSGWNWPDPDTKGPFPQTVTLSAGQHDIIVEYEQRQEFVAAVQLRWFGPGFAEEVIPIYSPLQAPPHSLSLYWQSLTPFVAPTSDEAPQYGNLDTTKLREFGCSEAKKRNGSIVVVLLFGDPIIKNGQYYTRLPSFGVLVKLENIETGVKEYISGYWDCSDGAPLGSEGLLLAVGVANTGEALNADRNPRAHGEEWGRMINRLRDWVNYVPVFSNGPIDYVNYSSRVSVVGAINIEKWSGNATPQGAREWVNGYNSTTSLLYFNVGACADCGFESPDDSVWDRDHYWDLSWGLNNAFPLPQIYNQTLAERWQELSEYGATCQDCSPVESEGKQGPMYFFGSFTQELACEQNIKPCDLTDFSPDEGWQALYSELNSDPVTRMENLLWSTDIGWDIYLDPSE